MMSPRSVLPIALLVGGCSQGPVLPALPTLMPYKMDIQQGNVVTQEMLSKLKPGMTQSQVRFILGTPLVVDAFHKDRWDYVYTFSKAGTLQEYRRIVIVFRDEKLARIEGDVAPAQTGATDGGVKIDKTVPPAGAAAKPAPAQAVPEAAAPAQTGSPTVGRSAGEPPPGTSAGEPPPGTTAGESQPGTTAGEPQPGTTAGEPQPGTTAGESQPGTTAGESQPGAGADAAAGAAKADDMPKEPKPEEARP